MILFFLISIIIYIVSIYYLYKMLAGKLEKENNVLKDHISFLKDKISKSSDLESRINILYEWFHIQTDSIKRKYDNAIQNKDDSNIKLLEQKLEQSRNNEQIITDIRKEIEYIRKKIDELQSQLTQEVIIKSAASYRILTENLKGKTDKILLEELLRELLNLSKVKE